MLQRMKKSSRFAKPVFFSVQYSLLKMFHMVLIMENTLHAASALFSVYVPQSSYTVKLGGEVVMECRFPVKDTLQMEELLNTWLHTAPSQTEQKEVYVLYEGEEELANQDPHFTGRATLLKEKLYTGAAQLQIINVSFSDRGTYICLISYRGAGYKHIDLIVEAPYATIHADLATEGEDLVLTCSAEGYPLAEVYWQEDSANVSAQLNTTSFSTADGLYKVTSTLRARPKPGIKYRCLFWNRERQETTSAELFSGAYCNAAVAESSLSLSYVLIPVAIVLVIVVFVAAIVIRKCGPSRNGILAQKEHRIYRRTVKMDDLEEQRRVRPSKNNLHPHLEEKTSGIHSTQTPLTSEAYFLEVDNTIT